MTATRNARFWIWHNQSWVKLTLQPHETLEILEGGYTDEGYSHECTTYTHDGDGVSREYTCNACDCDGPISNQTDSYCSLEDLRAVDMMEYYNCPENEGIFRPEWERTYAGQRDVYAEAMGY